MAYDGFLKIDGIPGESTDDAHKDWIEVLDYRHDIQQAGGAQVSRAGGRAGARVDIDDFSITKALDKSTPTLAQHCCTGKHIPQVIIELCEAAGSKHTYMKYTLADVIISAVKAVRKREGLSTLDEGQSRPLEEIIFKFGTIKWEYTPVDHTGKAGAAAIAGWSLETNKAM